MTEELHAALRGWWRLTETSQWIGLASDPPRDPPHRDLLCQASVGAAREQR